MLIRKDMLLLRALRETDDRAVTVQRKGDVVRIFLRGTHMRATFGGAFRFGAFRLTN